MRFAFHQICPASVRCRSSRARTFDRAAVQQHTLVGAAHGENVTNLLAREPFDVAQHHDLLLDDRQLGDRRLERGAQLAPLERLIRAGE